MTGPLARLVADAAGRDEGDLPPLPPLDASSHSSLNLLGLPFELSTGTPLPAGDARPAWRYVLDLGDQAGPTAVTTWAERTGIDAGALVELVDVALPAGTARRDDAPFGLWLGVVHPRPGSGPTALKLYACADAAVGVLDRVSARWPAVASMADLLPPSVAPVLSVAATATCAGALPALTVYRPVRRGYEHQAVEALAHAVGADAGAWTAALMVGGLGRHLWSGPIVVSTRHHPDRPGVTVGIDLSLADASLATVRAAVDALDAGRALDDLLAWTAVTGRPLRPTWLGVEADGDRLVGLSVYGVPDLR